MYEDDQSYASAPDGPQEENDPDDLGPDPARPYLCLPIIFLAGNPPTPAPFLMNREEVIRFFRLHEGRTKFPAKAIQRYRHLGLETVRVGRCAWYRLDDCLRFLDRQQGRVPLQTDPREKNCPTG